MKRKHQRDFSEYNDAPCRCSCGEWFDLDDGYRSNQGSEVICEDCHEVEREAKDIEDELYEIHLQMDNGEIGKREGKRLIKELNNRLTSLTKK